MTGVMAHKGRVRGLEPLPADRVVSLGSDNLSVLMRALIGAGSPREAVAGDIAAFSCSTRSIQASSSRLSPRTAAMLFFSPHF